MKAQLRPVPINVEIPKLTSGMMEAGIMAMSTIPCHPEQEMKDIWDAIWKARAEGR